MRTALLSDIHANRQALEACLRHARDRGVDRIAFLGDLVGYGADAVAVVDAVQQEVLRGAISLKGNHDAAIGASAGYFNEPAQAALDHARRTLSDDHKRFLAAMPLLARDGGACFVHASAASPERWDYVDSPTAARQCAFATDARHTFCGHVHDQMLYFEASGGRMSPFVPAPGTSIPVRGHRRWVAIVGSVGQPRDRNPAAGYAIFDAAKEAVTFHRVAYDHPAAAAQIRAAGLPESLAFRVEAGI